MTDAVEDRWQPIRQRIKILGTARKLAKQGLINKEMTNDEIADVFIAVLNAEEPAEYGADFDWAKFLELLMQLLPLIIMLFL